MRKFAVVLVALMAVAAIGFMGCESVPGAGGDFDPNLSFTIDFAGMGIPTRNDVALAGTWADFMIDLPEFPDVDFTEFSRVTITANYFNAAGDLLPMMDGMVMVTLVYDTEGDIRGPEMGPGPNTPLKQFNVGGPFGSVHLHRGSPLRLTQAPGGILFQNASGSVAYIEVTEVTFHNRPLEQ